MKYSILMPFLKRSELLFDTLMSFLLLYKDRDDFEIIIGEDIKNKDREHDKLLNVISYFSNRGLNIVHLETKFENCYNPAPVYNFCYSFAKGNFIILTSPECYHEENILKGLDEEFISNKNVYVVCGCRCVKNHNAHNGDGKITYDHYMWYQHSKYRNKQLHFCTAISRENYMELGGFDERFAKGIGYDDNDWIESIKFVKIPVILRDDLIALHLWHGKLSIKVPGYSEKLLRNKKLFETKWKGVLSTQ